MPLRDRASVATLVLALAAAAGYLFAPPMGTDLAAQTARAGFAARHGAAVWDLGWYGGISPFGYSLLTPWPMAWLGDGHAGPRRLGALALVASAVLLVSLLRRTGARRPLLGGVLGVLGLAGNLVSGRVTFAVGVAVGLAALLALTVSRAWVRLGAGGALAVLAAAASPVAGLFVGLAGVALIIASPRRSGGPARWPEGLVLGAGAAVPMVVTAVVFGAGGTMNISAWDAVRAVTASLVVAALVPVRPVRAGALLSAAGVLAAALVSTPVGLNAVRLAAMFALPTLAGYAVLPRPLPGALRGAAGRRVAAALGRVPGPALLAVVLVAVGVWQPPVSVADLRHAGDPAAEAGYFAPLVAELARRPAGRVEVVPTRNYWEAAYVPATVPLARGWLRQADIGRHPLFFDGSLDAASYEAWLRDNGVSFVALADAEPSWVGRREAALIRGGLPYLTPVWRGGPWTLYAVRGGAGLVDGGTVPGSTERAVTVDVTAAGDHLVRVRWSRWLRVEGPLGPVGPIGIAGSRAVVRPGGCLAPAGEWTTLRVDRGGRYRISAALTGAGPRC